MSTIRAVSLATKKISIKISSEKLNTYSEQLDNWERSFSYSILIAGLITLILLQI